MSYALSGSSKGRCIACGYIWFRTQEASAVEPGLRDSCFPAGPAYQALSTGLAVYLNHPEVNGIVCKIFVLCNNESMRFGAGGISIQV